MGCDVHMWAEVRRAGVWEKIGDVFPNAYADADAERRDIEWHNKWLAEHPDEDDEEYRDPNWKSFHRRLVDHPYDQRNYALYSILADVRNGYGFAGVFTGMGFTPIAPPRGVPEDASPEYRAEVAAWGGDGHSHSWLTLKELQAYDWHKTTCTGESGEFVEQVIPMLAELGAPDDVRIVFFFDN